jgi:hypothetical protein
MNANMYKETYAGGPETVEEVRRENLGRIREQHERSWTRLNAALGRSTRDATLSQVWNRNPNSRTGRPRAMGAELARSIEVKLDLPRGWMDQRHESEEFTHLPERVMREEVPRFRVQDSAPALAPLSRATRHNQATITIHTLSNSTDAVTGDVVIEMKVAPAALQQVLGPARAGDPQALRLLTMQGDAMRGLVDHGDVLMIDTSVRAVAHDGIYVLADAERVRVRRVSPRTGHWLLISDNASYPPEIVPDEARVNYSILGRAVFAFRCAPL